MEVVILLSCLLKSCMRINSFPYLSSISISTIELHQCLPVLRVLLHHPSPSSIVVFGWSDRSGRIELLLRILANVVLPWSC